MDTNTLDDNLPVFTFFLMHIPLVRAILLLGIYPGVTVGLQTPLIHGGQGETEKRGRPLQIGRWLV